MHAQLPSGENRIAHYPARGAMANPAGGAVVGAVVGASLGHLMTGALTVGLLAKPIADATLQIPEATEEEALSVAAQQQAQMVAAVSAWNRKRHALGFFLTTFGSSMGAYLGASDHQRRSAAAGAAVATGGVQALSVVLNPVMGPPGIIAGAVGAYIGAQRADRRG